MTDVLKIDGKEYSLMICNYSDYGLINIEQYRKAKKKVKSGRVGIYPKIDAKGELVYFLMHRKMKTMQILCDNYIDCPRHFIRLHKKKKYGYFYLRLSEQHAVKWRKIMEKHGRSYLERI